MKKQYIEPLAYIEELEAEALMVTSVPGADIVGADEEEWTY